MTTTNGPCACVALVVAGLSGVCLVLVVPTHAGGAARGLSRSRRRVPHRARGHRDEPGSAGPREARSRRRARAAGAGWLGQPRAAPAAPAGDRRRQGAAGQRGRHSRPASAAIVGLQALVESREGNLAESTRLWRRAVELDPGRSRRPPTRWRRRSSGRVAPRPTPRRSACSQQLLARADNLPARLDYARLAAKRGDAAALAQALGSADRRCRRRGRRPPASGSRRCSPRRRPIPRAAATQVAFLRNLLVRETAYRRALAQVTTPLDAVGEPIPRFLVLPAPTADAGRAGHGLRFSVDVRRGRQARSRWAGTVDVDGRGRRRRWSSRRRTGVSSTATRTAGRRCRRRARRRQASVRVVTADLNYDYRTDLVLAGAGGLAFLAVRRRARRSRTHGGHDARRGDAADADSRGLAGRCRSRRRSRSRHRADRRRRVRAAQQRRRHVRPAAAVRPVHRRCTASPGPTSMARASPTRRASTPTARCRSSSTCAAARSRRRASRRRPAPLLAVAAADLTGDGRPDLVGVAATGAHRRADARGARRRRRRGCSRHVALARRRAARLPHRGRGRRRTTRLLLADLDNNAALDLVVSAARHAACCWAARRAASPRCSAHRVRRSPSTLRARRPTSTQEGRLELVGLSPDGRRPWRSSRARSPITGSACGRAPRPPRATSASTRSASAARSRSAPASTCRRSPSPAPLVHVGLGEATTQRRRPDRLAERRPAVGVRSQKADATIWRRPAAQGLVPVAVRLERPRDGLRDRPDLAVAARPAHQRAGDGRRRR